MCDEVCSKQESWNITFHARTMKHGRGYDRGDESLHRHCE